MNWYKTSEELPDTDKEVLVGFYYETIGEWMYDTAFLSDDWEHWELFNGVVDNECYTHWTYITEPNK